MLRARKRVHYNALMVLLFGGPFGVALAIGVAQPTVLTQVMFGTRGIVHPMTTFLLFTGLPTGLFLRELWRSWRTYRAVCQYNSAVAEDRRTRKMKGPH
jgi:hypothetical protein